MNFKNIDKDKCLLIGFEGMDASYKETNTKFLFSYLNEYFKDYIKENKLEIRSFSFPNYNSDSSYFVKRYLNNEYSYTNLFIVSSFYILDMFNTLNDIEITKPTIIIFDRYYYSQMYYLTKETYWFLNRIKNDPKIDFYINNNMISSIENLAKLYTLPKLNFLYKMYNDINIMKETIKKRCEENGKTLDMYENDIEYLTNVRKVFLSDKYINKTKLENITGNDDILYNINVNNKSKEQVADDVKVAIENTIVNYKKILNDYWENKKDV